MQILIQKIHRDNYQNISLPMQQKQDSWPLQPHFDWRRILSSRQRPGASLKYACWKNSFFCNSIHGQPTPLKRTSNWIPPRSDSHTLISFFTRPEQELGSISTPLRKTYSNLTLKKKTAFNNLKNNQSIIIKTSEKGGGICIMNTIDYLIKIYTDLQDHSIYKLFTRNPTNGITHDAGTLIHYMYYQHKIDTATMEFLLPFRNTRTSLFYGISKIHKPRCPLHPIVSRSNWPSLIYVTHFIQPLANNLWSHIKDTKNFLNLIIYLPPLPTNAFLVTADVASLYSNIQHDDGVSAVIHFMKK